MEAGQSRTVDETLSESYTSDVTPRRLAIRQIEERPALKFIAKLSEIMKESEKVITGIKGIKGINQDKFKMIDEYLKRFKEATPKMLEEFFKYEEGRLIWVDIRIQRALDNETDSINKLQEKVRKLLPDFDNKVQYIRDKMDELYRDRRDLALEGVAVAATGINDNFATAVSASSLQERRREIEKKISKVCCPCTQRGAVKLNKYNDELDKIKRAIKRAETQAQAAHDRNERIKDSREEKYQAINAEIGSLKGKHENLLAIPLYDQLQILLKQYSKAAESYEKVREDMVDAQYQALKYIDREHIANLLFLLSQVVGLEALLKKMHQKYVPNLEKYTAEKSNEKSKKLLNVVVKLTGLLDFLKNNLESSVKTFGEFILVREKVIILSGAQLYRQYQLLDESIKKQFMERLIDSFGVLDQIITLAKQTDNLPKVSSYPQVLNSRHTHHLKRRKQLSEESRDDEPGKDAASSTEETSVYVRSSNGSGSY